MVRPTTQLRRARSVVVYWRKGRLVLQNFARRLTVCGAPITCEVLDFFSEWRTLSEAIDHFDYSEKSVRGALAQLEKHGLLLRKGSPEATEDSRLATEWSAWLPEGSFHFSTKDAVYIPSNRSFDRLKSILPKTPQPKFFKTLKEGKKTRLPPRTLPDCEFIRVLMARRTHRRFSNEEPTLETVSHLLSLVWGVTGYLHSPIFGSLPQKTSPSAGARHPSEVYLMALRIKGLRAGLYHYHPAHHYLVRIRAQATPDKAWLYCARQDYTRKAAALFLMTAVFARTMWKYQKPRAYRVVLQGHIDRAGPRDRWDPRIHALRNWYRVASHAFVNERWRL